MMTAIQQRVFVQPGGRVELRSPELPDGAEAEVIVLVKNPPRATGPSQLEALRALQASLNLTPEAAQAWIDDARAEREAWGNRG